MLRTHDPSHLGRGFESQLHQNKLDGNEKKKKKKTERISDLDKLNLVKFAYSGLVLGWSKFLKLPQLPQIILLALKLLKRDT